jgi:hypothetical protein
VVSNARTQRIDAGKDESFAGSSSFIRALTVCQSDSARLEASEASVVQAP